jgi:threonine aldolase
MEFVDLRSDTVTQPTPEMREAMANAPVGDDVYGEDPTINKLEAMAADMLGKEAGLFVASGTMGNLAAILAHCGRGDEVILGDQSHTFFYEAGGISALGGIHSAQLPNQPDGSISLDALEAAIRPDNIHMPPTRLIALENTHNRCGGTYHTPDYIRQVGELAHSRGISVHLDGARIFNAAAALGVDVRELTAPADSVTFCLSKGLCAPVGSVLCGSREFIANARRIRKQLGGGMRQAGILAAAGIVALETMPQRLIEDHRRAKTLAEALDALPGIRMDEGTPATNMIFFRVEETIPHSDAEILAALKARGVLAGTMDARHFRLVTHYWIDDEAVDKTIAAFSDVFASFK